MVITLEVEAMSVPTSVVLRCDHPFALINAGKRKKRKREKKR